MSSLLSRYMTLCEVISSGCLFCILIREWIQLLPKWMQIKIVSILLIFCERKWCVVVVLLPTPFFRNSFIMNEKRSVGSSCNSFFILKIDIYVFSLTGIFEQHTYKFMIGWFVAVIMPFTSVRLVINGVPDTSFVVRFWHSPTQKLLAGSPW